MTGSHRTIEVVAALVAGPDGLALMVRKAGTERFMQPGGKAEPGEAPVDALRRELREELGLDVPADRLVPLGTFEEDAANEPGHRVRAEVFDLLLREEVPVVGAEIIELRWVDPAAPGDLPLAPLSSEALLPLLLARR